MNLIPQRESSPAGAEDAARARRSPPGTLDDCRTPTITHFPASFGSAFCRRRSRRANLARKNAPRRTPRVACAFGSAHERQELCVAVQGLPSPQFSCAPRQDTACSCVYPTTSDRHGRHGCLPRRAPRRHLPTDAILHVFNSKWRGSRATSSSPADGSGVLGRRRMLTARRVSSTVAAPCCAAPIRLVTARTLCPCRNPPARSDVHRGFSATRRKPRSSPRRAEMNLGFARASSASSGQGTEGDRVLYAAHDQAGRRTHQEHHGDAQWLAVCRGRDAGLR